MTVVDTLLQATDLSKRFGGLQALDAVSFHIQRGEIYGLIGPNGAGKTTLFNVLTGIYRPEKGRCLFSGVPLTGVAPHRAVALGLARTFQNIRLFGQLTALENVMIGRHVRTHIGLLGALLRTPAMQREEADTERCARAWLDYVGLSAHATTVACTLSYGDQRRLEIARALASEPQLLALDEPAAGMNESETLALRALIARIRADGVTVLLIEHDMKLVMGLCDRVLVLEYGKVIAEGEPVEVQRDKRVIEAYLGRGAVGEGNHG